MGAGAMRPPPSRMPCAYGFQRPVGGTLVTGYSVLGGAQSHGLPSGIYGSLTVIASPRAVGYSRSVFTISDVASYNLFPGKQNTRKSLIREQSERVSLLSSCDLNTWDPSLFARVAFGKGAMVSITSVLLPLL